MFQAENTARSSLRVNIPGDHLLYLNFDFLPTALRCSNDACYNTDLELSCSPIADEE